MFWTNYHSHTSFSDGNQDPREYVLKAVELGLKAFGFSCHAPVPYKTEWSIKHKKLQKYFTAIDELKAEFADKIEIYKGLEIDYFKSNPYCKRSYISSLNLDYFIGAIHFIDEFKDGTPWNFDFGKELFLKGFKEIFRENPQHVIERFYGKTMTMLYEMKPVVLAHFDKIKMINYYDNYFSQDEDWYVMLVEQALDVLNDSDVIMEINTKGKYRGKINEQYPSSWILHKANKLNIPVTISSDCHSPELMIEGFQEVAELLLDAGYRKVYSLIGGRWVACNLHKEGLTL